MSGTGSGGNVPPPPPPPKKGEEPDVPINAVPELGAEVEGFTTGDAQAEG